MKKYLTDHQLLNSSAYNINMDYMHFI